jgi:hypothetical protein
MKNALLVLGCTLLFSTFNIAAQNAPADIPAADLRSLLSDLKDARNQTDILNQTLNHLSVSNVPIAWVKALNLKFIAFDSTASGKDAGLGVQYDYNKAVTDAPLFGGDENTAYLTFNIKAKGTISFDKNNNPADFLESGLQLHLWQYFGQTADEPVGADGLTLSQRTFRELAKDEYRGKSGNEIRATPIWQNYVQQAFDNDPSEFFYDVAANAALESNQTFSKKQLAYGLEAHARFRAWDPDSVWSKFNFFDWPFAATRMLGGEKWQPRGRYIPGVMVGIDLVDPVSNTARFAVDPVESAYPRFKFELGFRSKVMEIEQKSIWFNAGYRYFQELGASSAIKAAGMDSFGYFAASLDLPWNFSITYSTGKLPFDLQDQQVWALGYHVKF